jgi:hypothetical protein
MHPRGGGHGANCGGDATGTAATITPAANAGVAELDNPASGLPPAAARYQHRAGEEGQQDDHGNGRQQGLQPLRQARGGRRSRSPRQGMVPRAS